MRSIYLLAAVLWTLLACAPGGERAGESIEETALEYPQTARVEHVDTYFGVEVEDPYRWLEDLASAESQQFVASQNGLAQPYLEAISLRQRIVERMTALWRYERAEAPLKRGGRYFFEANDGSQEQNVLMVAESLDAEPRVLIDPNAFSDDATVSLANWEPSPDGAYVAYGISDGGTDWKSWKVRDVAAGSDLDEHIRHLKFSSAAWAPDSSGFYYSRYPVGADGEGDGSRPVTVYFHRVGTPQSEDAQIYATDEGTGHDPYAGASEDGRFLVFNIFEGYSANAVYYRDLKAGDRSEVVQLLDEWDALYTFLGNRGEEMFFSTTNQAPNGRVVAIDVDRPSPEDWREVVPQGEHTLESAHLVGGRVIVHDLVDARSRIRLFELDGREAEEVTLPGIGTVDGFKGKASDPEVFYELETYTAPLAVYRFDASTGESTAFLEPRTDFDADAFTTEQVFYASKDGTRVPMFLIHRKGLAKTGDHPDPAVRLRRLQLAGDAGVSGPLGDVARDGRSAGGRQPAWR